MSLILPDELRPYGVKTQQPIDFIYNPFGVFSRMNLSQVLELTCAKPTWLTDQKIRSDPKNIDVHLSGLCSGVLSHLGNDEYCNDVKKLISIIKKDNKIKNELIESIISKNLFIEVPSFTKIDLNKLLSCANPAANEDIIIPKKTIEYMKQRLGCFDDLIISNDLTIPNAFVGPMYIQKLHKIADKLIMARDLGPLKSITQQPRRGRASGGGAALGQMEIESIIASGCETALTELLTVKNDWNSEKKKFLWDLISTGKYNLPETIPDNSSRTKTVVNTLLKFLKN